MSDSERHPHFCECSGCMNRGGGVKAQSTLVVTPLKTSPAKLALGRLHDARRRARARAGRAEASR